MSMSSNRRQDHRDLIFFLSSHEEKGRSQISLGKAFFFINCHTMLCYYIKTLSQKILSLAKRARDLRGWVGETHNSSCWIWMSMSSVLFLCQLEGASRERKTRASSRSEGRRSVSLCRFVLEFGNVAAQRRHARWLQCAKLFVPKATSGRDSRLVIGSWSSATTGSSDA